MRGWMMTEFKASTGTVLWVVMDARGEVLKAFRTEGEAIWWMTSRGMK